MIETHLGPLLAYAVDQGLIGARDVPYVRNRVLEVLRVKDYDIAAEAGDGSAPVDDLLAPLLDDAAARGLIDPDTVTQRDLWDTAIMGCFVPEPQAVQRRFWADYEVDPVRATDIFHRQAVASNYIRVGRTDRNITWQQQTAYGVMDMTINVSKPEKDPRDIAAAVSVVASGYPQCLLCRENEGYAGRADHPARQNLRLIGLRLDDEPWFLQYSPYRYYNEHCIVLSEEHRPMAISMQTFARLVDFARQFPHYVVGSNADLPIVGGSILSHDHFQGGRYEFAMDRAQSLWETRIGDVSVQVLNWPLAVLRLTGPDAEVVMLSDQILRAWRVYDDSGRGVLSHSGDEPHNTITPIARRHGDAVRMDLVLRNNRTDAEHPDGIYHPHAQIHPIKRENIGLIEVMGLAVLPGRLERELEQIAQALVNSCELPVELSAHAAMLEQMRAAGPVTDIAEARERARLAVGAFFVQGLEHCGVFGSDQVAGCQRFLASL